MKQKPDLIVQLISFALRVKKTGIMLSLFIFLSAGAFANNDQLIKSAAQAYEKGKYEEAIKDYEQIISSGNVSFKLYYNTGNAYYKNNQIGKAIYYYELAHKLEPANEDVKHNLTIVNKLAKDQIDQKENYFAKNIEAGILNFMSTSGWAWLSIVALFISCVCFALFRATTKQSLKRSVFWMGTLTFIVCLASFIIGYIAVSNMQKKTQAIILAPEISVVNAPTKDAKTQFSLHEGTKVHIVETNAQWTAIKLDNGNEGWVQTKDIGLF